MRSDVRTQGAASLVDVLDRVLDKGLVVAGDIKISVAEVELLTIRIRLIVCSLDKAEQIGLDWWKYDRHLSPGRRAPRGLGAGTSDDLEAKVKALEDKVQALSRPRRARGVRHGG